MFLNIPLASTHFWLQNPCVIMYWIPTKSHMWFYVVIGSWREVIKVEWGHKDGALIQYDWCPYKKREEVPGMHRNTEKRLSASQGKQP